MKQSEIENMLKAKRSIEDTIAVYGRHFCGIGDSIKTIMKNQVQSPTIASLSKLKKIETGLGTAIKGMNQFVDGQNLTPINLNSLRNLPMQKRDYTFPIATTFPLDLVNDKLSKSLVLHEEEIYLLKKKHKEDVSLSEKQINILKEEVKLLREQQQIDRNKWSVQYRNDKIIIGIMFVTFLITLATMFIMLNQR